jgi:hypothetical protein
LENPSPQKEPAMVDTQPDAKPLEAKMSERVGKKLTELAEK